MTTDIPHTDAADDQHRALTRPFRVTVQQERVTDHVGTYNTIEEAREACNKWLQGLPSA